MLGNQLISQAHTLQSLHEPIDELLDDGIADELVPLVPQRGHFTPAEDERLAHWLARYLSLRGELWFIINSIDKQAGVPLSGIKSDEQWRCFMLAYTAACLLVRVDRYFLFELAVDKLIQKKLNQSFKEYRIPPKSYTKIFDRFTNPKLALKLLEAMWFVRSRRRKIRKLESDEVVGVYTQRLPVYQSYLDPSKRNYLKRSTMFVNHLVRRKFASAKQKSMFAVLEKLGRATSELSLDTEKLVTKAILDQAEAILRPGDVLVTRHKYALTNLFLPGVWPHAALYVGNAEQRSMAGIRLSQSSQPKWHEGVATFEALKDGVRLRPLSETLSVDAFIVLRPNLSDTSIKVGIGRVLKHEGKRYNFDFDFFRSDRLVCTEVIYRAFDEIDGMHFTLKDRAGRRTLSAEDLLDMALDSEAFEVVAVFGYPRAMPTITMGERATQLLIESYR